MRDDVQPISATTSRHLASKSSPNRSYPAAPIKFPKSDPPSKKIDFKADNASPTQKLAREVRERAPGITETYVAYGVTEKLVKECARHGEYTIPQANEKGVEIPKTKDGEDLGVGKGWWYEGMLDSVSESIHSFCSLSIAKNPVCSIEAGLTPTYNNWAQITFLHMYLLTVRMRCFPPDQAPAWNQHMIDHFSYLAEDRMVVTHNIAARMIRNRYLKDLFVQWRGLTAAYDEGLVRGDAVLATAVWRNVFKANADIDLRRLGQVVSYMRNVLNKLEAMEDEGLTSGDVVFGDPGSEAALVKIRSKGIQSQPQATVA